MAGIEPATPALRKPYSNQLSYIGPIKIKNKHIKTYQKYNFSLAPIFLFLPFPYLRSTTAIASDYR